MLLEDCVKDCMYFDKKIDSTFQSVKKMNKEAVSQSGKETNE
ncbi:4113_t:CDS:1, partial [Funneliformis mosseae]